MSDLHNDMAEQFKEFIKKLLQEVDSNKHIDQEYIDDVAEDYAYNLEYAIRDELDYRQRNELARYPLAGDPVSIYGDFGPGPIIDLTDPYETCNWTGNTPACAYGFFTDDDTQEHSVCIKEIQPGKLVSVLKFLRTEYRLDTFKLIPMQDVKEKLQNLPLILETFETRGEDFKERILDIMVDRDKLIAAGAILEVI